MTIDVIPILYNEAVFNKGGNHGMRSLQGKIALVAGATRGAGRGLLPS